MGYLRSRPFRKKECPKCARASGIFNNNGDLDPKSKELIMNGEMKYGGGVKPIVARDRYCKNCGHMWLEPNHFEVHP